MKVSCPRCEQTIPAEQINVAANVAYCPRCAEAFALSKLVESGDVDEGELTEPPAGCWFQAGVDEWHVGATTRSAMALFLIPFTCIWSGGSLGAMIGGQIVKGRFDLEMSLFAIPFILGSVLLISFTAMTVCGKVVLSVRGDDGEIFTGVGTIGWRRRFAWSQVRRITERISSGPASNWNKMTICLEGPAKWIQFASLVKDDRRAFMAHLARRMLVKPTVL
jgi:hypothetical protein